MYHRAEREVAYIAVAGSGEAQATVKGGPAGRRRSRDGALLRNCVADCTKWLGLDAPEGVDRDRHFLLANPSLDEVEAAIVEAGHYVLAQRGKSHWNGGGISIWYSGHGHYGSGGWALTDGVLGGENLVELLRPLGQEAGGNLGLELGLDSCHSGTFLAYLLEASQDAPIAARDMYISSLPEEISWELDDLGHGAMAFTLLNPGNAHVDQTLLAAAVRGGDDGYLRLALQGFVPNPVTYLTEGDQKSLELVSGHHVDVKGAGCFELPENFTAEQLIDLLTRAGEDEPGRDLFD